ncbi:hydroxycinnamoyltransferase-like [Aristolochia californica]|uniref:hydroxycinnamoyltransferase-like n=1 Tax=Aristolochia californica TaxID=171875 RepID=UPI0035D5F97A
MIINVRESSMVRPAEETPKRRLWNSDLDLLVPRYSFTVYFFRPNASSNFFDSNVLKDALGKALVPFYPLAGRLGRDENGRIDINCNREGALFVEADTDSYIDDMGGFAPSMELRKFIPAGKDTYTGDVSYFPLVMVQVTRFKCGGVIVGTGLHHFAVDGSSALHFVNHWADIARLGSAELAVEPYMDRTPLRPRHPPTPSFPHVEYQPPPTPINELPEQTGPLAAALLTLTREQLILLKSKASSEDSDTTYEALTGHIWRCACKARDLPDAQESKVYLSADGRNRLKPPLPPGFFGNPIFIATPIATVDDLVSRPLSYAAGQVRKTLARMDDEYLRSSLDYLALQPDLGRIQRGAPTYRNPNLGVNSWARLPMYEADFGWGRPAFVGPVGYGHEGKCYVLPSPTGDGSMSLAITLLPDHMVCFKKLLYEI